MDLLSTRQAAERLGTTVSTLNRWAAAGKIEPALTGEGPTGARWFRPEDVDALADQLAAAS